MKFPITKKEELEVLGFRISPIDENEEVMAKRAWENFQENAYINPVIWSKIIYDSVMSYKPKSVLEFGSNAGRNLKYFIDNKYTGILHGTDINYNAVEVGKKKFGLNLYHDTGSFLDLCQTYDVVFTVSVLDHIPNISNVLRKIFNKTNTLVALEIRLPLEGRIDKYYDVYNNKAMDAISATYSWKLEKYIPIDYKCTIDYCPLPAEQVKSGPYYFMYKIEKHE